MRRSFWKTALAAMILLAVLALAAWRILAPWSQQEACDLSTGPCSITLAGEEVRIDLEPRRPMVDQEMVFSIESIDGASFRSPQDPTEVEFGMPGMDMGDHRMTLELVSDHRMQGSIALPACPMGHSLWVASIHRPDMTQVEVILHVGE